MVKTVELLSSEEHEARNNKYEGSQQLILNTLEANEIPYQVNGDLTNKLPHVSNPRLTGEVNGLLLTKFDLSGVVISTGSARTAENTESSHVLETVYEEDTPILKESTRISFGLGSTEDDIQCFPDRLAHAIKK